MWLWHTRQLGLLIGLLPGKYHHHLSTDSSMTWTFRILFLPSPSGQSLQWSQLSLFTTLNHIHPTQTGSHDFSELMLFLATMLATGAFLSFTFYLSSCPAPYALLPSPSTPQPFQLPISLSCQHPGLSSCAGATVNGVQSFILVPAWGVERRWICG